MLKNLYRKEVRSQRLVFWEDEPRHRVPTKEIETPKRKLSFEDSTDDGQLAEEIEKDIKDAEQAQWALETERMQIEIERVSLERERQRIAEERLKALRQQRKGWRNQS